MRMQQLPHLKTQKNRPIGRLMQFSSPRFREVHRTLTGEEEPVNPRSRATKGVGTQGCQHSYFLVALSLTVRLRLTSLALAGGEASGEDRATLGPMRARKDRYNDTKKAGEAATAAQGIGSHAERTEQGRRAGRADDARAV